MVIPQVVKEFSSLCERGSFNCSVTIIRHLSQMHPVHALRSYLIPLFRIKFLIKIFQKKFCFFITQEVTTKSFFQQII